MTQVSAKSPRIPSSISENLEVYNQWETYLTNFTQVKASNMHPVAQSGLDSVYESTGYAWPLLQSDQASLPSLQQFLIYASSSISVILLIATRNYLMVPIAGACIFIITSSVCQPRFISFVNGTPSEEWSLGISGLFCVAVSLCLAAMGVAQMVLAVAESPRSTYIAKIEEAYLRTGIIATKSAAGNILVAIVLF
jgi:hypothetical protein